MLDLRLSQCGSPSSSQETLHSAQPLYEACFFGRRMKVHTNLHLVECSDFLVRIPLGSVQRDLGCDVQPSSSLSRACWRADFLQSKACMRDGIDRLQQHGHPCSLHSFGCSAFRADVALAGGPSQPKAWSEEDADGTKNCHGQDSCSTEQATRPDPRALPTPKICWLPGPRGLYQNLVCSPKGGPLLKRWLRRGSMRYSAVSFFASGGHY